MNKIKISKKSLKKIKNGDFYFILLNLFLFIQVFSESQLNESFFLYNLFYYLRLFVLASLAIQAFLMIEWQNVFRMPIRGMTIYRKFIILCIILILINTVMCHGGQNLLSLLFIVIASKRRSLKKIFKHTLISLASAHIVVIILCLFGFIKDDIAVRWIGNVTGSFFEGEYVRHAFGFLHSNQLPLVYMLLLFMYVAIRAEKFTIGETVFAAIFNYIIFKYCGSRISFMLVFAFLAFFWLARIFTGDIGKRKNWLLLGYIVYPAAFFVSLILAYAYKEGTMFWTYVNLVFNNRLNFAHKLLTVYPFSLFGYGKYAGTYSGLGEATADNGYVLLFLQAGLLLSVMIIILHEYIMHICIKKKCTPLVLCLIFVAIENLINAHMPSYKLIPLYCILVNSQDTLLDCKGWKNRKQIELINKLKYISGKIGFKVREIWESKRGIK